MIVTAAIAADMGKPLFPVLLVATLAALLADLLWYAAGNRFCTALLKLMCELSLSPDSCVGLDKAHLRALGCAIADRFQVHPRPCGGCHPAPAPRRTRP